MADFIIDDSIQTSTVFSQGSLFTTKTNPNLRLSSTAGLYYPSENNFRVYTNSIDAFTIDNNQILYGNGAGLTNLTYNNINGKPTNFQADWTSTIINKPDILTTTQTTNLLNTKQDTLTASTGLLGIGSNVTSINYNNLFQKPDLTPLISSNVLTNYLSQYDKITDRNDAITSLSNMYVSSNVISNHLYTIQDISTPERQYPPKAYNSTSGETTTTLLSKTVYTQTFTLNTDGISYGSGNYIIYSSSTYGSILKNLLFDYNLNNAEGAAFQSAQYISPQGTYNGVNNIVSGYNGDWIILKFPTNSVTLTKFTFKERSTLTSRAPAEWKCYGSNDGITFVEITQASQAVRLVLGDYVNGFYTKTFSNSTSYQYIGFTINKVIGGANSDMVNFSELQLFGKEFTTPLINPIYISSNVLSNILLPYALTNFYDKSTTDILLNTKYNKSTIDTFLSTKQNTMTASTALLGIGSSITALNYGNISNPPNLSQYALSTDLTTKQNTLTASTTLLGIGSSITALNYANISNPPNLSQYALSTSLSTKQNTLTASTTLLGIGSSITQLNYANISNPPTLNFLPFTAGVLTGQLTLSTVSGNNPIYITSTSTTANNCIQIKNNSTYNAYIGVGGTALTGNYANNFFIESSSSSIILNTNGRGSASTPNMIIHSTGNVGIGTTNPSQLLDVRGNIFSQGISVVDSTSYTNQYQLSISPPTSTTSSQIQTIQQGVSYNQNLNLQPNGGTITLTGATNCVSTLNVGGILTLLKNNWVLSSDNVARLYFGDNGTSYFHSGNTGTGGFNFRNFAQSDIFTINENGNVSATGNITTGGIVVSNSGISTFKSIYITNPNNSITHFPFTNGQNYIRGKLNIDSDDLYVGGLTTLNNVLTLNNSIKFKTDVWNSSSDTKNRLYFENNSTSIYQGYGNFNYAITHEFRDNSGAPTLIIYNVGDVKIAGQLSIQLYSVNYTGYDSVGVLDVSGTNQTNQKDLVQIWNSFTAFHRCFTDDELFNIDAPQDFKDNYMGRVVVSAGIIKTDTSISKGEWEIRTGKEAIIIEDAHPTVELSRKKKDKRVFGVLGLNTRNNSRAERLIVNSIGEGGMYIINSNSNIENGDYIQSSDYLGYGEKQDDDLLHNYTVAKATIDCYFELDSQYYICFEIDDLDVNGNKLRVAFIAVTYHCG